MGDNVEAAIVLPDDVTKIIHGILKDENIEDVTLEISEATVKGDNYLGKLFRVKASGKNGKSMSFIVKCAPTIKIIRDSFPFELIYGREIGAYSVILPVLDGLQNEHKIPMKDRFRYAKYYDSISAMEKESIIISDLSVEGYKMYNKQKPFDKQHLEVVMKTLARLHATSFVLKKTKPTIFEQFSHNVSRKLEFGETAENMIEMINGKCVTLIESAEIRKRVEDFLGGSSMDKCKSFLIPKRTAPYNVICHGDCWNNNFLFKYENDELVDMRFVDWQIIRLASPITDIAYTMFSSTDEQMRLSYYTSSLDLYYETLDKNITMMGCKTSECYPMEVFRDQIKSTMPYGLLAAMMLLPTILCDKDNLPDTEVKPDDFDNFFEKILTQSCRDRINGVVKDLASNGFV